MENKKRIEEYRGIKLIKWDEADDMIYDIFDTVSREHAIYISDNLPDFSVDFLDHGYYVIDGCLDDYDKSFIDKYLD